MLCQPVCYYLATSINPNVFLKWCILFSLYKIFNLILPAIYIKFSNILKQFFNSKTHIGPVISLSEYRRRLELLRSIVLVKTVNLVPDKLKNWPPRDVPTDFFPHDKFKWNIEIVKVLLNKLLESIHLDQRNTKLARVLKYSKTAMKMEIVWSLNCITICFIILKQN